jgi:glucose-6-phosphate 1-dehydrogenase
MKLKSPLDQDFVIIGATGNLARKKLLPTIYNLALDGLLPAGDLIIGHSSQKLTDDKFAGIADAVSRFSSGRGQTFGDRLPVW